MRPSLPTLALLLALGPGIDCVASIQPGGPVAFRRLTETEPEDEAHAHGYSIYLVWVDAEHAAATIVDHRAGVMSITQKGFVWRGPSSEPLAESHAEGRSAAVRCAALP